VDNASPSDEEEQPGHVVDHASPSDEDIKNNNVTSEINSKLSNSSTLETEPPVKRRKLDVAENEDERVQSEPSKNNNGSADDGKSTESISPQSRRRKKAASHNEDDDDDAVEKWANAIIKYHQQTEDLRTRYASCYSSIQIFCEHVLTYSRNFF